MEFIFQLIFFIFLIKSGIMDNYNGSNLDQTFTPLSIIETTINPPPKINGPQSLSSQFPLSEKNIEKVKIGLKNNLKMNPKFSVGKNNKIKNYGKLLEEYISSSPSTPTTTTEESNSTLAGTIEILSSTSSVSTTTTFMGSTTTGPTTTFLSPGPTTTAFSTVPSPSPISAETSRYQMTTSSMISTTLGSTITPSSHSVTSEASTTNAITSSILTGFPTTSASNGPTITSTIINSSTSSTTTTPFTSSTIQSSSTFSGDVEPTNTNTTEYLTTTVTSIINDNITTTAHQQTTTILKSKTDSTTTETPTTATSSFYNSPTSTSDPTIYTDDDNVTESFNISTTIFSATFSFSIEENHDTTTTLPNSTPSPTTATTTTTPLPMTTTTTEKGVDETCQDPITNTTLPKDVSKAINDTKTKITEKINDGQFNSTDIHDTGAYLYNITLTVSSLDTDSVKSIIEIINAVAKNASLDHLQVSSELTKGSMLWYIDSIPKIVNLADSDINGNVSDSKNLQLHSQSLNKPFCDLKEVSAKEICQETENGKFCATFDPKQLCGTGAKKVYIALWRDLKFHIVSNNAYSDGIKFGSDSKTEKVEENEGDKNTTEKNLNYVFSNAGDCETEIRLYSPGGVNTGGTGGNNKDQNDLHIVAKQAVFKGRIFTFEEGGKVSRGSETYEANCPSGTTCTITFDGNTSDPITCTPILRWVEGIFGAIGAALTIFSFIAFIMSRRPMPPQVRCCFTFFQILLDKSLSSKARKFAFAYNIIFTFYILYLVIFSYKKSDAHDWVCTASAVVGYQLYLWGIFLTIIMLLVTLEELGNWRPTFQFSLQFITGFEKTYVPFIYGFGIPLIMTLVFAATMVAFFNRNDGYCWIRSDYSIPALWIPLGLLLISLPLYIPLIARQWPNNCFASFINRLCCCCGHTQANDIEAAETPVLENQDEATREVEEVRSNHIISRLIVPQVFLGIPLIAENFTLYYAKLTGYHYAFILTLAAHLIIIYSVSVYLSYKTAMPHLLPPPPQPLPNPDVVVPDAIIHMLEKAKEMELQPFERIPQPPNIIHARQLSESYVNIESENELDNQLEEERNPREREEIEQSIMMKEEEVNIIKNVKTFIVKSFMIIEEANICSRYQTKQSTGISVSKIEKDEKEKLHSKFYIEGEKPVANLFGYGTDYENTDDEEQNLIESDSEKNETVEENLSATETSQISNDFGSPNFFHHQKHISIDEENIESGNENETNNLCDDEDSLGISSNETISLDNFDGENENFDNLSSSSSCTFPESENDDFNEERNSGDDDNHCDFSDMEENSKEK